MNVCVWCVSAPPLRDVSSSTDKYNQLYDSLAVSPPPTLSLSHTHTRVLYPLFFFFFCILHPWNWTGVYRLTFRVQWSSATLNDAVTLYAFLVMFMKNTQTYKILPSLIINDYTICHLITFKGYHCLKKTTSFFVITIHYNTSKLISKHIRIYFSKLCSTA